MSQCRRPGLASPACTRSASISLTKSRRLAGGVRADQREKCRGGIGDSKAVENRKRREAALAEYIERRLWRGTREPRIGHWCNARALADLRTVIEIVRHADSHSPDIVKL